MEINRHKVFISYYHDDDQYYKDTLIKMNYYNFKHSRYESIFEDCSVNDGDIDDNISAEQIRRRIRDEFIRDATVLILLCGEKTKYRKHIDWEIHAAMYNSELNPKMGIIVINLPTINQYIRAYDDDEKKVVSTGNNWISISSRIELEKCYPYMPARIIDSFVKNVPITVVEWNTIADNPEKLLFLIDKAYKRKNTNEYDLSRPLRRNNN